MRCSTPNTCLVFLAALLVVLSVAGCSGCFEECAGPRQGSEGCSCASDQDCTTVGAVLLCNDGTCQPGDPPDAHGPTSCTSDSDCDASEACAVDATCQPAPLCQRLEPREALTTRARDTLVSCVTDNDCAIGTCSPSSGECLPVVSTARVTPRDASEAPRADCGFEITVEDPALTAAGHFARDGELVVAGCLGRWFAAHRVGFLDCGGQVVALSDATVTTCLGRDCGLGGCRALGDGEIGVCP